MTLDEDSGRRIDEEKSAPLTLAQCIRRKVAESLRQTAPTALPANLAEAALKRIDQLLVEGAAARGTADSAADRGGDSSSGNPFSDNTDQLRTKRCPACNEIFAGTVVVCRHDGTLLIPVRGRERVQVRATSDDVQLLNFIGEGTLTKVYSGQSRFSGDEVVVKQLKRYFLADQKTTKRFIKQAQHSLKLEHPNIVRTFAIVSLKEERESFLMPALVTEKIHGPNLKQLLAEHKRLAPYVVAMNMIDVCSALQYALSVGVAHNDLKPSNIYISIQAKDLVVKVVDFGLAERLFRNLEWSAPPLPDGRTASIYGDPSYTSPESAFSGILSTESEIYSLGCIMYEAVSGINPFIGNNHFVTLVQHKEKTLPPLEPFSVAPTMEAIIFKCLQKDPQNRYHSFDELKEALQSFAQEPAEKS